MVYFVSIFFLSLPARPTRWARVFRWQRALPGSCVSPAACPASLRTALIKVRYVGPTHRTLEEDVDRNNEYGGCMRKMTAIRRSRRHVDEHQNQSTQASLRSPTKSWASPKPLQRRPCFRYSSCSCMSRRRGPLAAPCRCYWTAPCAHKLPDRAAHSTPVAVAATSSSAHDDDKNAIAWELQRKTRTKFSCHPSSAPSTCCIGSTRCFPLSNYTPRLQKSFLR